MYWISSSLIVVIILVLLGAGNYFYNESVKRGIEVELYKGSEPVLANEDHPLLEESKKWFKEQTFEIVELTSDDSLRLQAKFKAAKESSGKAVILAHGYRGTNDTMGDLVKFYYDQGFDILLPDARGHGQSEGDYIGYGWHDRKDYLKWVQFLIDNKNGQQILLHGNSMGAALVLMTSGEKLPIEVKGIIADSGYTSVKEELSYQLKHLYKLPAFPLIPITSAITSIRAGYSFDEASAIKQVEKNTRPLFIIHGDADELVPTEMAYRIYDAANSEKELWIVPGVGHTKAYTVATAEYQTRLKNFIEKVVGK